MPFHALPHLPHPSQAEVPLLDIPYATPLVYRLDGRMAPMPSEHAVAPLRCGVYLGDAGARSRPRSPPISPDLPNLAPSSPNLA